MGNVKEDNVKLRDVTTNLKQDLDTVKKNNSKLESVLKEATKSLLVVLSVSIFLI